MSLARRRATVRLLVELLLAGLYSAHSVLLSLTKHLAAGADFGRDPEAALASLSLLTALAKAGREELLGLPPALPVSLAPASLEAGEEGQAGGAAAAAAAYTAAVQRYEAALKNRYTAPPEAQATLRAAVERCFDGACEALQSAHTALQATEAENARVLNSRGDLPEDMAAAYEAQRKSFEGLQRAAAALAEVLDKPLPELQAAAVTRMAAAADEGAAGSGDQQAQQVSGMLWGGQLGRAADRVVACLFCQTVSFPCRLVSCSRTPAVHILPRPTPPPSAPLPSAHQQVFEDEESRAFYESLVDLRAVVPAVLLGEKGKDGGEQEGGAAAGSEPADGGGEAGSKKELAGSASSASLGGSKQELSYDDILEVSSQDPACKGTRCCRRCCLMRVHCRRCCRCWATCCATHNTCPDLRQQQLPFQSISTQQCLLVPPFTPSGQGRQRRSGGGGGGGTGALPAGPAAGPPAGLCEQGAGRRAGGQLLLRPGGQAGCSEVTSAESLAPTAAISWGVVPARLPAHRRHPCCLHSLARPHRPPSSPLDLQNKGARKRLVRALTAEMPAGALALLPFYARIAATLAQVFPDISAGQNGGRSRGVGILGRLVRGAGCAHLQPGCLMLQRLVVLRGQPCPRHRPARNPAAPCSSSPRRGGLPGGRVCGPAAQQGRHHPHVGAAGGCLEAGWGVQSEMPSSDCWQPCW